MPETKTVTAPVTELNKNNVLTYEGLNYYHKTIQARIDEAKKAGTDAAADVAKAKSDAADAVKKANTAVGDASTALSRAEEANKAAGNAVKKADTASQAAAKAETNASAAQETATSANTKAGKAEQAATEAKAAATKAENAVASKADNSTVTAISGRVDELEKVKPAEKGAQVNTIENIKVNGHEVAPVSKAVDIPLLVDGQAVTYDSDKKGFNITLSELTPRMAYVATRVDETAINLYKSMKNSLNVDQTSLETYFSVVHDLKIGDILFTPTGYVDFYIASEKETSHNTYHLTILDAKEIDLTDYAKKSEAISSISRGETEDEIAFRTGESESAVQKITINNVGHASTAGSAENVVITDNGSANAKVAFKIGTGTFSHTVNNVGYATSAGKAAEVSDVLPAHEETAKIYIYNEDGGSPMFDNGTPVWAIQTVSPEGVVGGFEEHKIITDADAIPTSDINKILGI